MFEKNLENMRVISILTLTMVLSDTISMNKYLNNRLVHLKTRLDAENSENLDPESIKNALKSFIIRKLSKSYDEKFIRSYINAFKRKNTEKSRSKNAMIKNLRRRNFERFHENVKK